MKGTLLVLTAENENTNTETLIILDITKNRI